MVIADVLSDQHQIEVRYFPKANQVYPVVDPSGFLTAVPEMIAYLFQLRMSAGHGRFIALREGKSPQEVHREH